MTCPVLVYIHHFYCEFDLTSRRWGKLLNGGKGGEGKGKKGRVKAKENEGWDVNTRRKEGRGEERR